MLEALARCATLRRLDMAGCTHVTDEGGWAGIQPPRRRLWARDPASAPPPLAQGLAYLHVPARARLCVWMRPLLGVPSAVC